MMQASQLEQLGVNHVAQYYKPPPQPASPAAAPLAARAEVAAAAESGDKSGAGRGGDNAAGESSPEAPKRAPGVTRIGRPSALHLLRPKGGHTCRPWHRNYPSGRAHSLPAV